MSFLSPLACRMNRHAPLRREVAWGGRCYVGECRHCGAAIERHGHRDWRRRPSWAETGEGAPSPH